MYILDDFYEGLDKKIIYGAKCSSCGIVYFPPIKTCQTCLRKVKPIKLPPTGVLKNYIQEYGSKGRKKKKDLNGIIKVDNTVTPIRMRILNTKQKSIKKTLQWGRPKQK